MCYKTAPQNSSIIYNRYIEYSEIEVTFLNIQLQRQSKGHKKFTPPSGLQLHNVNTSWRKMEDAEHARDVLIRQELLRYPILLFCLQFSLSFKQFKNRCLHKLRFF